MSNLFVYGTLVPQDFFRTIADRYCKQSWDGETKEALLLDYNIYENGFKCVAPHEGHTVSGVIHTNIEREHFLGLDQYECDPWLYTRTPARAILSDGTQVECFVYVGKQILSGAKELVAGQ